MIEIEGNSWARSHSTDGRSDYAGSLTYQDYNNLTAATIGNGVLVNQTPAFASPQQSVQVTADSDIYTLDIAGLFELVIDVTAITDTNAYQNAFQTGGLPALLTEIQNAATTYGMTAISITEQAPRRQGSVVHLPTSTLKMKPSPASVMRCYSTLAAMAS